MSLALNQNATAIAPGMTSFFAGSGGTPPYAYSIVANGAGGTIDPVTGFYSAPFTIPGTPISSYETVQVADSVNAIARAQILIGTPISLFCEILQTQMQLAPGRVYFWDQKINQPTDNDLYIAVSIPTCKPFANSITYDSGLTDLHSNQSVNMLATVDVDIISRGPAARDQKELVLMALNSVYSEQQQEANSFYISRLPAGGRFINLSQVDGAAIPYRYKISMNMQYAVNTIQPVQYFSTFLMPTVATNP